MATSENAPFSVVGKTAIVTGAGSGINFCFAKLLLSKGCNVLLADIALRPEAKKLVDSYSAKTASKPRAVFLKTDVVDWQQLRNLFEVASREFETIDLVCPGAGIFEPHWSNFWHPPGTAKAKDSPDGGRYALVDINITHPIRTTQLAISYFLSPAKGARASPSNPKRIVHVSSIAGQNATFAAPMYCASKHAISGFVYSLQPLDALGIRVNGVGPGIVKTPLWTDHPEKNKFLSKEQDEWATPEEVAQAMLDCAQDDDLPGGIVLEVGRGNRRKVPLHNNPGPSNASGLTVSDGHVGEKEVFDWLARPGWRSTKL